MTEFEQNVVRVLHDVKEMLIGKNTAYGNSALEPVRIFAKGLDPTEQIKVRIDDKLSRIFAGPKDGDIDEDIVMDLMGYLVLYKIATSEQKTEPKPGVQDGWAD